MQIKQQKRYRRHKRVRAKIFGDEKKPRLCVFRSGKHIYAQLINDKTGKTMLVASDSELNSKLSTKKQVLGASKSKGFKKNESVPLKAGKIALAFQVGRLIAEKAKKLKIENAVFDRGGYKYHGRIKSLEEGAREGGLKF